MTIKNTIVIPAFNESARLAPAFERLRPTLEVLSIEDTEVIVVDDGSSDDTLKVAHDVYGHLPNSFFVQQPANLGKGAAVRLGVALARGERVISADADMSIDPRHFPEIVAALGEHPLAPGSRAVQGRIHYDSPLRILAGGVFSRLVRHYTGTRIRDTQCGAKGYQRGPGRVLALFGMVSRFAYDAETFFLATQLGLDVHPVPVTWQDIGGSSVHVVRDSLTMIRDLRAIRGTRYENPAVQLDADVDVVDVDREARRLRTRGLVVARGPEDAMVVLARDGALAGAEIARALGGTLRTVTPAQLRGRRFDAV